MKLSKNLEKMLVLPLALTAVFAGVAPAFAHHDQAAKADNFSCKREDLGDLKKSDLIKKLLPSNVLVSEFASEDAAKGPQSGEKGGMGSGAVIDAEKGYVLTNNHVIHGMKTPSVRFYDPSAKNSLGPEYETKIVGKDAGTDLAVLQIVAKDAPKAPCVTIGDSNQMEISDKTIAIGNPFGMPFTVTEGIVSGVDRFMGDTFKRFIQTDAPINPGNSGGALYNLKGELIGVNTQIISAARSSAGLGFALDTNTIRPAVNQLIEKGEIKRGRLGVAIQNVKKEDAAKFGMKEPHGALVQGMTNPQTKQFESAVTPDGPGSKAGIKDGDVIISFGGHEVKDNEHLTQLVAATLPGTKVDFVVLREGKEVKLEATLGERPPEVQREEPGEGPEGNPFGGPGRPFGGPGGPQGPGDPLGQVPQQQQPQSGAVPNSGGITNHFNFGAGSNPTFNFYGTAPQGLAPAVPQGSGGMPQGQAPGGQQFDPPPGFFDPGPGAPQEEGPAAPPSSPQQAPEAPFPKF
jgi:S1-C subfamily serine protease